MRRKIAITTLILMLFNLLFTNLSLPEVYGEEVKAAIHKITIVEEFEYVNGAPRNRYEVIFNGDFLRNIDGIQVVQQVGGSNVVRKTISEEQLRVINNSNVALMLEGNQSIQSIFGATGTVYFRVIQNGTTTPIDINKPFELPADNFNPMKVDRVKEMSPASWPVTVLKGEKFAVDGSNFNPSLYQLRISRTDTSNTLVSYTLADPLKTNQIIIDTDIDLLDAGNNQNLIFEKNTGTNVEMRYIVRNAINVANPLDLEEVSISPLQGTAGTIVRIKAKNSTPLLDSGTKVFVGGVEAPRNKGGFSDGTFTYYEGAELKRGIEVVVPTLSTSGQKPIVIRNLDGDTYTHHTNFEYLLAEGPILEVIDADPDKAYTNEEKLIDSLRVRNVVPVNNIKGLTYRDFQSVELISNPDDLDFFKDIDARAKYFKYEVKANEYVERKINIIIGLPADIVTIPFSTTPSAQEDISILQVRTSKVSQAGKYPISVRTETVHYRVNSDDSITELSYIVEEAPYTSQKRVEFEFEPDMHTPTITRLVPNRGPFTEHITATIEGTNFRVSNSGGVRHYPMVIIGSENIGDAQQKYKVITKNKDGQSVYYFSDRADGTNLGDEHQADFDFQVLTANNTIVDGQAVTTGTKIKFTIPAGAINYNGYADVIVFNPSTTGTTGGRDRKDNEFQYITPDEGTILRPDIQSVSPDKVAVGRPEQVVVRGYNFQPGAILTIDGEIITNRTIDVARGTITFTSPQGRVGKTQLQVINPDGGFDTADFEFIQTHSQPYIQRIIPNVGGEGSLVIIKGSGFFAPQPNNPLEAYRRGTTVLIDGKDINRSYHPTRDADGNILEAPLFINDYFNPPAGEEPVVYGPDGPLRTYGRNVAVVDTETIYVLIPDPKDTSKPFFMNAPLDVRVVNPDLGSHEVKRGFTFIDVVTRPRINSIEPSLGDYRGGNIVEIQGENFNEGVKVFFGTQEAQVYRRSNNARTIWAYVPAYGGEMGSRNQVTVPVTVLNTNGGSATDYNGYVYVNPGYDARITQITPNIGNTAGGDRVMISGINFRADFGEDGNEDNIKLPAVYFGGIKVEEKDITFVLPAKQDGSAYTGVQTADLIIVENTPAHAAGRTDVTVINFDGATANLRNGFEYRSKQPAITQVLPNQGSLLGGSEITIVGRDFVSNGLHVVFGNETDKADIFSGISEVRVGDIIVKYDAHAANYNISLFYKEATPGNELMVYKDGVTEKTNQFRVIEEEEFLIVRVPWNEVDSTLGLADEQIKIEIKNNDLILTRRLGIIKRVEGEARITLVTPPAAAVGQQQLRVFNADGKFATSQFNFTNPFRAPIITNIIPATTRTINSLNGAAQDPALTIEEVSASPVGGSPIIIEGENFRSGVKVFIGDKEAEIRTKSPNDDELIVVVPAAVANTVGSHLRILVINTDGGAAYGDVVPPSQTRNPFYFRYIPEGSSPTITNVTPAEGSVIGGTKVTIKGTEFKDEDSQGNPKTVSVLVGGIPVPQANILEHDPQAIVVIMPAGRVGKQTIEVINYDHGRAIATDAFTYISKPRIETVDPNRIFTNDTETIVTITGEMFQQGAKVIIGGTVVSENDVKAGDTVNGRGIDIPDANGNNRKVAVIGGKEAASVVVEDAGTIKVRFNEALDLQNSSLIIVNPDGGVSEPSDDFEYRIPIPTKPLIVEAIPGAESSVTVIWSESDPEILNKADRYEVYAKRTTDARYTFIGDTRDAQYLVRGLLPNTQYTFMVRAMNQYGSAIEFAEVTVRTFNQREDQQLQDKNDQLNQEQQKLDREGKVEISNGTVIRTIGKNEISPSSSPYLLDFSLSQYNNQNKFVVAIPVATVQTLHRPITITDGKMSFTVNPRDLYTSQVSQVPQSSLNDAHVRIEVTRITGAPATSLYTAIDRNHRRASEAYEISFQLQVGRNITEIGTLLRPAEISLNYDAMAYPTANRNRLFVGEYSGARHSFTKVGDGQKVSIRQKGRFILLSER
ncbi:IPT/TIG domain-containing protein [Alkaliphilus transvaalensis]|uniref:IPT/TIG domain-containing protein n=1 Tax=Alkaliphilus transvaalensis TaxID=114628 RepID=UPI00047E53B8|nr:IPT/TIG domain-containing protein [Alkaliphilus transvaalensis]